MVDSRVTQLAELVSSHSMRLTKADNLLIQAIDIRDELVAEFVRVAQSHGANVVVRYESNLIKRQMLLGMTEENAKLHGRTEKYEMEQMTACLMIRGASNLNEHGDVPSDKMALWQTHYAQPVTFQTRIPNTKWVVLRWPNPSMAQQAGMSTPAFEDFFFRVCLVDYAKMGAAAKPLEELMARTDQVRIVGPGTDLNFSIKGIGAVRSEGRRNIPDGECYTCPVKDSMNGTVQYNTATLNQGAVFNDIRFVVKNGKIVEATAGDKTQKLNDILDTDEGARYFGEWSLGFNPHILHPMLDTLFDEKIAGSFHLTPGNAYDGPGGNGNKSAIHWDIVNIQRPDYGGGEIWFDGRLIRKDGIFVVPELEGLNPNRLV
ncbi:MAG: aminopeptidase [Armatimonadetes bacterium]|nr:aminopeptidase [Armatimonadota bacterium]